jgi:enamine deaminase RidA (YjgF/YER057c/UK114 family)
MPLENPQQTPAYDYQAVYSPKTPKFSRAMAVVQGHFVTTLVSGTASIVDSKTCFPEDIVRQTEQTIENIERLIAPENFARHGMAGSGATLADIAKLRVYVKHPEDYEKCRAVCERLLPGAPAIYLHADVCRPDLLVRPSPSFSPPTPSPRVNGHSQRKGNTVVQRTLSRAGVGPCRAVCVAGLLPGRAGVGLVDRLQEKEGEIAAESGRKTGGRKKGGRSSASQA